ncbi:MAG: S8 family serine peptidase [Planctomycetota bacterium]
MVTRLQAALSVSLALTATLAAQVRPSPDSSVDRLLRDTGAPVAVWIEFVDKGLAHDAARAAALDAVARAYDPRAIGRRQARRSAPGLFDARDLPVAADYVARTRAAGAAVRVVSRWLNAASAVVDASALTTLRQAPFVRRISLVRRGRRTAIAAMPATGARRSFYGMAQTQLDLIKLPLLHNAGFTGQGVVIGVLDTGFRLTHDAFTFPAHPIDVVASWDFVDNDPIVAPEPGDPPNQHDHGTQVLGAMAAYLPNTLVGAAYDASYVLCKTEDTSSETPVEEDYYVAGLQFAEAQGADVVTSSLGYIAWYTQADLDGRTAMVTQAVNVATANGVHCCTAAGNGGHDQDPATSSLLAPADAFDVVTCGSVAPTWEISSLSSDGPTADGRVKPEVMAQGEVVYSVSPSDDTALSSADGTSMSTPLVAGTVACLAQAHAGISVASMRERLTKTAGYFSCPSPDPFFVYGYGVIDALAAHQLAGTFQDLGGGIPGASGTPALVGVGSLVGTETVQFSLDAARASAPFALVLGAAPLLLAYRGGLLVPSPDAAIPAATTAAGTFQWTTPWVPGLPSGTALYLQAWVPDGLGPQGFAASNGLSATAP